MIAGGKIGDIYGTKRVFTIALIVYGVGTLTAALAPTAGILILGWSVIEGLAAAALMPISMALIVVNYTGRQRAVAFGVVGGVAATASAIGPLLGGFLTTNFTWRWGFGLEVAIVVVVIVMLRWLKGSDPQKEESLDVVGTLLAAAGFGFIVLASLLAGRYGWLQPRRPFLVAGVEFAPLGLSPVPMMILIGVCFLVAFVHWQRRRERRGETPLFQLSILANGQYLAGVFTDALESLAIAGLLFIVHVYLQQAQGFTALETGIALLPLSVAILFVSLATPPLGERIAPKILIQIGAVLMGVGTLWYWAVVAPNITSSQMAGPFLVFGAGVGLMLGQVTNITLSAVAEKDSGEASGAYNTVKELGTSLGVALIGSILIASFYGNFVSGVFRTAQIDVSQERRDELAIMLEDAVEKFEDPDEFDAQLRSALPVGVEDQLETIVDQAVVEAMQDTLLAIFGVVVLTFLATTFFRRETTENKQQVILAHPEESARIS